MSIENVSASSVAGTILQTIDQASNVARKEVEKVQAEQVLPSNNQGQERFSQQEMDRAVEQVQVMMDLRNRSVEFTTDASSGARVVKVVDANSGDVIRQMPAEELLSFMRNLTRMLGTFIDKST
jgi:flagellar protein FlaG